MEDERPYQLEHLHQEISKGANWFYWIAGLSIVNSVLIAAGSETNFLLGLGFTLMLDVIANQIESNAKYVVLGLSLLVAGLFVFFGKQSGKPSKYVFIAGMILYGLDSLVYLAVQEWLSFGFHIFALVMLYSGFKHISTYESLAVDIEQNPAVVNVAAESTEPEPEEEQVVTE